MGKRKPFVVEVTETVTHLIPVRAKDREQAERKAEDIWVHEGGEPYYHVSDWSVTDVTQKGSK